MAMLSVGMYKKMPKQEGLVELDDEMTAKLQAVLMNMLSDIDAICTENDISYVLGGGSCLGAVRHHGFIPWDDDVDLIMLREDWTRFREAFESRFSERYFINEPGLVQGYDNAFPRVVLKGTQFRDISDFNTERCGVFVDIFFADAVPDSRVLARVHGCKSLVLGYFLSCVRYSVRANAYFGLTNDARVLRGIRWRVRLGRLLSFRTPEQWAVVWDKLNCRYKGQRTRYVTVPTGRNHYFREMQRREDLFPANRLPFCGSKMPVPANYKNYLTSLYGSDYMTPPSVGDRETHVLYEFDLGEYGDVYEAK